MNLRAISFVFFAFLVVHSVVAQVTGWGFNDYGQTVAPGLVSIKALAGGYNHSLALKDDGTVVGWGLNNFGQTTPPSGLTGVRAIAAGAHHNLAIKADGTVVGWGLNNYACNIPPPGLAGVTAIAAGMSFSLALKSDGTVVGWGLYSSGQTNPPTGLAHVKAIAAGYKHGMALKTDGTVVCWGDNSFGQATPPPGLSGINAIAASSSGYTSLALKNDGTIVGWGLNNFGQATAPPSLTSVRAISAGSRHSMALKSDGTVICWGDNTYGQANIPASLTAGQGLISAGGNHCLAFKPVCGGTPQLAWTFTDEGFINGGQNGAFRIYSDPAQVSNSPWVSSASGSTVTLRVNFEGDDWCRLNSSQSCGYNSYTQTCTAVTILNPPCNSNWRLNISWEGLGETFQPDFEKMEFYVDNILVASAHAPGGGSRSCVSGPIVSNYPPPPQFFDTSGNSRELRILATTADQFFNCNAYYQFNMTFQCLDSTCSP